MRYWKTKSIEAPAKVGMGIASYLNGPDRKRRLSQLRCLLASLEAQTHEDWRAIVVHDGPVDDRDTCKDLVDLCRGRTHLLITGERLGQFGHPNRRLAIEGLQGCQWIGLTNEDNYYMPVFMEWLVSEGQRRDALLVHADMVHSHKLWQVLSTSPKRGRLDLGGMLVRAELATRVPFDNYEFAGDGHWINKLAEKAGNRVAKVPAVLFVHN
jgi:hypothetical protein